MPDKKKSVSSPPNVPNLNNMFRLPMNTGSNTLKRKTK